MTPHTEMFNDLLKLAVDSGASDIVIKSNKPGYVRISGRLKPVDMDPITCPEAQAFVAWRDAVWIAAFAHGAAVEAGEAPPTLDAALAALPVWGAD